MKISPAVLLSGTVLIVAVGAAVWTVSGSSSHAQSALPKETAQTTGAARPSGTELYRSSVVGTDFDFITDADPSAFERLEFLGFNDFEMPDKRDTGEPLVQKAYVFAAHFSDGTIIQLSLDKDFGSRQAAEQDAAGYGRRLGKLPALYRRNIKHVTVNFGGADTTAFAEDKGHFFTIYSGNATKRIGTHDLEETFFHEGTHASIQAEHLESAAWKQAVSRDGAFITSYAKSSEQEDFAESALFAYTIIYHPDRFPQGERAKIAATIPNRIAFFRKVFARTD